MKNEYKQIKVNVFIQDWQKIQDKSKKLNMTMAQYIRHLTNTKTIQDKRKQVTQNEKDTLRELNSIGVNLNQIARHLNQGKEIDKYVLMILENITKYINEKVEI
nr:plasmid mobilization relaxosome protein MobC [Pseudodesulfovibrio sp.]